MYKGKPIVSKKEHEKMSINREPIEVTCKACGEKTLTRV